MVKILELLANYVPGSSCNGITCIDLPAKPSTWMHERNTPEETNPSIFAKLASRP